MSRIDFKALREELAPDHIISTLAAHDVQLAFERPNYLAFPTACHNVTGGSPKLVYYKDSHLFTCFTECDKSYDIFSLLIQIEKNRGNTLNLFEAIERCGLRPQREYQGSFGNDFATVNRDIDDLYRILTNRIILPPLPVVDSQLLNRFVFEESGLKIWNNDNISYEAMKRFNILYDTVENRIIIPNYDIEGRLIGIRARFYGEFASAKYKPIFLNGKLLSHPTNQNLYGLNLTKGAIQTAKAAILFEGEKSVLQMETIYGKEKNFSAAVLGQNVTRFHIQLLEQLNIKEVVLAFDADYNTRSEFLRVKRKYFEIAQRLKPYFNVSVLLDDSMELLEYKASPIEGGKEKFEKLLKNRIFI